MPFVLVAAYTLMFFAIQTTIIVLFPFYFDKVEACEDGKYIVRSGMSMSKAICVSGEPARIK